MDAVNCSFSSRIDSKARKAAFKIASDAGIAIFCSAGNNQPSGDTTSNTSRYPAKYPFTYANANIRADKTRYPSSCIGHGLNFSKQGSNWNYCYIPRTHASMYSYSGGVKFLVGVKNSAITSKFIFISDTKIKGHLANTQGGNEGAALLKVISH